MGVSTTTKSTCNAHLEIRGKQCWQRQTTQRDHDEVQEPKLHVLRVATLSQMWPKIHYNEHEGELLAMVNP